MQHDWRTIVPSREPAHLVRGTEIEVSIPAGFLSRFAIYAVRTSHWEKDGNHINGGYTVHDVYYHVRDAFTVSDAESKAGARPKVVGRFETLGEVEAFIAPQAQALATG